MTPFSQGQMPHFDSYGEVPLLWHGVSLLVTTPYHLQHSDGLAAKQLEESIEIAVPFKLDLVGWHSMQLAFPADFQAY